jgi:hypothetical protein
VIAARMQLLLSAYAPLFAILAVRFQGATLKWICGVLAGVGVAHLIVVLAVAPRLSAARPYPVDAVEDASGEVAGFLATYLLPFVTVPSPSVDDVIGYLIFAAVVIAIFLRSNLAQVNPTLYVIGWRVVSIEVNGRSRYLVCRHMPRVPTTIQGCGFAGLLIRVGG